jgi:hypothetical protein
LKALKGERAVSELASVGQVLPSMIHPWSAPLCATGSKTLASARAAATAEIAKDTVRDLHAKIGELAVANDLDETETVNGRVPDRRPRDRGRLGGLALAG